MSLTTHFRHVLTMVSDWVPSQLPDSCCPFVIATHSYSGVSSAATGSLIARWLLEFQILPHNSPGQVPESWGKWTLAWARRGSQLPELVLLVFCHFGFQVVDICCLVFVFFHTYRSRFVCCSHFDFKLLTSKFATMFF